MYVPNPSSQHPDGARNSMFRSRNHTRIKRFFGERPPSEVISSNLTSFFPNHKPDLLETAGINAKRLSTTRRNSAASRIDIRSSSRNSVLPELVSVLGVDMDKFVEEDEEDDDDGDDDGESVEDNDDTDSNDGNSFDSDNNEHHDDDTRDTSLEQRNRPTSKLDNGDDDEDGDEDDEDDFKSAAEAFKEQHLNGDTDTDTTVISDNNNNNLRDDEKMSPEQQLISQQNRSTSLSYLNGSKQRDLPIDMNETVAKEMNTSSSLHSPTSPQPATTGKRGTGREGSGWTHIG